MLSYQSCEAQKIFKRDYCNMIMIMKLNISYITRHPIFVLKNSWLYVFYSSLFLAAN